jgi:hypothetical protein
MVDSGAKGAASNIGQIVGVYGQSILLNNISMFNNQNKTENLPNKLLTASNSVA